MASVIFVSHSVYLTPEELNILGNGPAIVETQGVSMSVLDNGDHVNTKEFFCKYVISNMGKGASEIITIDDGYKIDITESKKQNILNGWLSLKLEGELFESAGYFKIYHQVLFTDVKSLEESSVPAVSPGLKLKENFAS